MISGGTGVSVVFESRVEAGVDYTREREILCDTSKESTRK